MKIPARCNHRECQARRNLSKMPEEYVRWPTCHLPGCTGKMYVDKYRLRKGSRDRAPLCKDDCYHYPHRHDSPNCKHYEGRVIERSLIASKHNPNQNHDTPQEAPF